MKWKMIIWMVFTVSLGCAAGASAQSDMSISPSSIIRIQRDTNYEQNLRYLASADTAITPARVLRWMGSLTGHTDFSAPSDVEFQPVLRVRDSQKQLIGLIAYKF